MAAARGEAKSVDLATLMPLARISATKSSPSFSNPPTGEQQSSSSTSFETAAGSKHAAMSRTVLATQCESASPAMSCASAALSSALASSSSAVRSRTWASKPMRAASSPANILASAVPAHPLASIVKPLIANASAPSTPTLDPLNPAPAPPVSVST